MIVCVDLNVRNKVARGRWIQFSFIPCRISGQNTSDLSPSVHSAAVNLRILNSFVQDLNFWRNTRGQKVQSAFLARRLGQESMTSIIIPRIPRNPCLAWGNVVTVTVLPCCFFIPAKFSDGNGAMGVWRSKITDNTGSSFHSSESFHSSDIISFENTCPGQAFHKPGLDGKESSPRLNINWVLNVGDTTDLIWSRGCSRCCGLSASVVWDRRGPRFTCEKNPSLKTGSITVWQGDFRRDNGEETNARTPPGHRPLSSLTLS
jgi:hypothetical protein